MATCQTAFGTCDAPVTGPSVSPDGTCGDTNAYTCAGSSFGDCCSTSGYCGSADAYCTAATCQIAFGTCDAPVTGPIVSPDSSCGGTNGYICTGSVFGDCCSAYGVSLP